MSVTYHINCTQCRVSLWIGQNRAPVYYGNDKWMQALGRFLVAHTDHPLQYSDDGHFEDFEEFEGLDQIEWNFSAPPPPDKSPDPPAESTPARTAATPQ